MSRTRPRPLALRLPALLAAALLLVAGSASPASAADDGGVAWTVQTADNDHGAQRPNFTYDVVPGQVIADAMVVTNTGTVALPLDVYAADAFTTTTGNVDILAAGTPSVDAGTWVSPGVTTLTLPPGETAEVPFTITVPADASPGDHAAGLLTSLIGRDATQVLEVDRRLGSRINLRVAGELRPAAAVTLSRVEAIPSFTPLDPMLVRVTYRLENTGNTRITGSETLDAHTVAGLLGVRVLDPELPEVLPRSAVEVSTDVSVVSLGWVGGTLTVAAQGVGLGSGTIAPVEIGFGTLAIPWALLVVVLLLAGATVGVLLWVRAVRRKRSPGGAGGSGVPAS